MVGRRAFVRVSAVLSVLAGLTVYIAARGAADTPTPSVRLSTVFTHVDATRATGDKGLFLQPGIYIAPTHGTFEVDATATAKSATLMQVSRDSSGVHNLRKIVAPGRVQLGNGLPGFFHVTVTDATGKAVSNSSQDWCPAGFARTDASGPLNPTFPEFCGSPLTESIPWGLDSGWAGELFLSVPFRKSLPDGDYTLTVAIAPSYVRQLAIPPGDATITETMTVTTDDSCGPKCPPPPHTARRNGTKPGSMFAARPLTAGLTGVPDMRALPAHDLSIETDSGHDYLDFAATIWNGGSGPLSLEGFRAGTTEVMPVTQFFYVDDQPAGSQPAGEFVFDNRVQHDVWDMTDIAQYDLLDASGNHLVQSQKQSFCLGATDPINLTAPGADWQPGQYDGSSCGGEDAIWIREALPAGWGDTYFQSAACQAFDITALPNGTYQIRVTTDPAHVLAETDYTNNTALLTVHLAGTPGARTVTTG